jgi:hypothetical protein
VLERFVAVIRNSKLKRPHQDGSLNSCAGAFSGFKSPLPEIRGYTGFSEWPVDRSTAAQSKERTPDLQFPTRPRDRLAVTAWPFRAYIASRAIRAGSLGGLAEDVRNRARQSSYPGYFSMEFDTNGGDPFAGTTILIDETLRYLA